MTRGWVEKSVDELAFVGRGKSRHRPRNEPSLYGGEHPFVQTAEIHNSDLWITAFNKTYSDKGLVQSKMWEPGTICITNAGENTGDSAILGIRACFPDSVIAVIADPRKSDTIFLKYAIDRLKPWLRRITRGATQDNLSVSKLISFKFPVPPLDTQRKIGEVLRAYGDLIENNRRRIQLLEQAARLLYKEWFVHLRFPGHEHVKIIDGIPEGWEKKEVAEIVRRVPAGKLYSQKSAFTKGKVPILDQGRSGLIGFHDEKPSVQPTLDSPVIVFANHTCYQKIIHFPFSAIQNVLPFIPSEKYKRNIYWLHYATEGLVKLNAYKGHWPEFMAKEPLIPPMGLCSIFGQAVRDNHLMIYWLEEQNKRLTKARELLLPRLMNGVIEV